VRHRYLLLLLLLASEGFGAGAYKCHVSQVIKLSDDGTLDDWDAFALNRKEFVVDRGTGRMTGAVTNHNMWGKPQVVDYGSHAQAFKVITVYKPMVSLDYLYVEEFADSTNKPFLFLTGNVVVSGLCASY
jgi:hypothetical protein